MIGIEQLQDTLDFLMHIRNKVSPQGLAALRRLNRLKTLHLNQTSLTERQVHALRQALPDTQVLIEGP